MGEVGNKLDKLLEKVEGMDTRIHSIDKTLAVTTQIVDEHQRRSIALEKHVSILEKNQNRFLGAFVILQIAIPIALKLILK